MVTGRLEVLQGPRVEYWVFPTDLASDDKHNMQLDPMYIPQPTVNNRLSSVFHLPIGVNIAYDSSSVMLFIPYLMVHSSLCQLLENERLLLVLVDKVRVTIYLEHLHAIDRAIQRCRPAKVLNREKLGQDALFAFDETTRALAVCAPTKVHYVSLVSGFYSEILADQFHLHFFVFDETFKTLWVQGTGINFAPWYSQAIETSITHIAFVRGTEEVVFIDSTAQARIFSFVSMQFRCVSTLMFRPYPPDRLVDQLLYSFRRRPTLYSLPRTVLAFSLFTLAISSRPSPRIIGRPSAPLPGFPSMFLNSHSKVRS